MSASSGQPTTRDRSVGAGGSPFERRHATSSHGGFDERAAPSRRRGRKFLFAAGVVGLLGTAAAAAILVLPAVLGDSSEIALPTYAVRRGSFDVVVSASGTLESLNSPTITCEVEGGATIIEIVDNGRRVTQQDVDDQLVLVELDSSTLRNQRLQQLITVQEAENAAREAELQVTIVQDNNESLLDEALVALETAQANLEQYRDGDYPLERETISGQITLAQQELSQARERVRHFERLVRKGYASQSQLEAERLAQETAEINFANAERQLRILDDYTYHTQIVTLEAAVRQADAEVRRVRNSNEAALAQAEGARDVARSVLEAEREGLAELDRQIAACTVSATVPGTVVYVRPRDDNAPQIAEGVTVFERQEIMRVVPADMRMDLEVRVGQADRTRLRPDMPAVLTVDGLPGRQYGGRIRSIGTQPEPTSWWRPDDDIEYLVLIEMTDADADVEPGMRAEASVVAQHVEDSLFVPRQAVVRRRGRSYCYVMTSTGPERRRVTAGSYNNAFIALEEGEIEEGDRVLLVPGSVVQAVEGEGEQGAGSFASPGDRFDPAGQAGSPSSETYPSGPAGGPPRAGEGAQGGLQMPSAGQIVSSLDTDGDGRVSRDEAGRDPSGRMGQFFDATDANSDGFLDEGEIEAGIARLRAMMQQGGGGGGSESPDGEGRR